MKIEDYLKFGVSYVWVVDPQTHKAWTYTSDLIREVRDGILRTENPASRYLSAKYSIAKHLRLTQSGLSAMLMTHWKAGDPWLNTVV